MSSRRNTTHRVETFDLLDAHASAEGTVKLSNRVIRDMLAAQGRQVTLPAITARLQSLETLGHIEVRYAVGPYGRLSRTIYLRSRPSPPTNPRKQAITT